MPPQFLGWRSTVSDAPINADARLAFAKVIHERLGSNSIPGAIDGVCEDLLWKIINTPVCATRIDSDGFTYDGEFLMGKRHGMGKSTHPDTLHWHPHEGYWENDVRCGKGKETNSRGYSYEGNYENDEFNGLGKAIYSSGKTYEGEYKNGYEHGYGERNSPKAVCAGDGWARERSYKGYWDSSDPEGKGIMVYTDGQISEGDFVRGLEHGYCKVTYADDRIYEGAMRRGYAFGRGKWTYSTGHEEGMWHGTTLYDDVDNADDLSVLLGYTFLSDDEGDTGSETDDETPGVYAHGL